MSVVVVDGAVCQPNISLLGRRRRQRIGGGMAVAAVAALGATVAMGAGPVVRGSTALLAMIAAVSVLQAQRVTCVARAREGTFEDDQLMMTPMADDDVARSRTVASGIIRDGVFVGVAWAILAAGTTLVL